MNWADEDLYRDFLKDWIDLFEDCDIDCQARGSQLTTIAGLMAAVRHQYQPGLGTAYGKSSTSGGAAAALGGVISTSTSCSLAIPAATS